MLYISLPILISCIVLLVLSIMSGLMSSFSRLRLKCLKMLTETEQDEEQKESNVSVVVIAKENNRELRQLVPLLLEQNYNGQVQVVVVSEKGDAETKDILDFFSQHKNFYSTFVPTSSRYMSRKKLAITLGVKAAKYNDVVVMDANCKPQSNNWLRSLSKCLSKEVSVVVPYTQYGENVASYYQFYKMQQACYEMALYAKGKGHACISKCVLLKKEQFLKGDGFRGFLEHVSGEYDFLVNKYATLGKVKFASDKDAWLLEERVSKKQIYDEQLFYQHTKKFLQNGFSIGLWKCLDNVFLYLNLVLIMGCIVCVSVTQHWLLLIAALVAIILNITFYCVMFKTVARFFQSGVIIAMIPFYLLNQYWQNMFFALHYKYTSKEKFTTHKV